MENSADPRDVPNRIGLVASHTSFKVPFRILRLSTPLPFLSSSRDDFPSILAFHRKTCVIGGAARTTFHRTQNKTAPWMRGFTDRFGMAWQL